jgi:hypothetical protein
MSTQDAQASVAVHQFGGMGQQNGFRVVHKIGRRGLETPEEFVNGGIGLRHGLGLKPEDGGMAAREREWHCWQP